MEKTITERNIFIYTFQHDFNSTWEVLKDICKTNRMCNLINEGFASKPIFTKMSQAYEVGAEFEFVYKSLIKLHFKCQEVSEQENYAKIVWQVITVPDFPTYDFSYILYGDVRGTYSTLITEQNFSKDICLTKDQIEESNLEKYEIYKNINKLMEEEKNLKIQSEYILVDVNISFIWEQLLNFKEFLKLIPSICDEVDYEGDYLMKGQNITFKWNVKSNAIVYLFVKSIKVEKDNRELILQSTESYPPVPKQIIEWSLEKFDEDKCKIKLTHLYNEIIKKESLDYMSKVKKKILVSLKKNLERKTFFK